MIGNLKIISGSINALTMTFAFRKLRLPSLPQETSVYQQCSVFKFMCGHGWDYRLAVCMANIQMLLSMQKGQLLTYRESEQDGNDCACR